MAVANNLAFYKTEVKGSIARIAILVKMGLTLVPNFYT
jgi:hypothetical protein